MKGFAISEICAERLSICLLIYKSFLLMRLLPVKRMQDFFHPQWHFVAITGPWSCPRIQGQAPPGGTLAEYSSCRRHAQDLQGRLAREGSKGGWQRAAPNHRPLADARELRSDVACKAANGSGLIIGDLGAIPPH